MLSNSPGGVNFERAPFKLTAEYMHIMDSDVDGRPSRWFNYFKARRLCCLSNLFLFFGLRHFRFGAFCSGLFMTALVCFLVVAGGYLCLILHSVGRCCCHYLEVCVFHL